MSITYRVGFTRLQIAYFVIPSMLFDISLFVYNNTNQMSSRNGNYVKNSTVFRKNPIKF